MRLWTALRDGGSAMMVNSVSVSLGCVMEVPSVMIDQMNGQRPVRIGTALNATGNVQTI